MFALSYLIDGFCHILNSISRCRRNTQPKEVDSNADHLFNISNDILKLRYNIQNRSHYICLSRDRTLQDIKDIYEQVTNNSSSNLSMIDYPVMMAKLNGKTDITDRINNHLGNEGSHLRYGDRVRVRYILTPKELFEFESLNIITNQFQSLNYNNINDEIIL